MTTIKFTGKSRPCKYLMIMAPRGNLLRGLDTDVVIYISATRLADAYPDTYV